jgi:hypothetical protein
LFLWATRSYCRDLNRGTTHLSFKKLSVVLKVDEKGEETGNKTLLP